MYNEKDILARLQNGEDAEVIIKEIVDKFNVVNKKFEEQKKAEEEKAALEAKKKEDLHIVTNAFINWMSSYYAITPEEVEAYKRVAEELNVDEIIAAVDEIVKYKGYIDKFITAKPTEDKVKVKVLKGKDASDVFDEFFKTMKW